MIRSSRQRTGDRALDRSRPSDATPSRGSMGLAITPGHIYAFLFLALLTLASEPAYGNAQDIDESQATGVPIKVKIEGFRHVELVTNEAGQPRYYITQADGAQRELTPDAFAYRLYLEHAQRSCFYRLLNISSAVGVAWVVLGLFGQLLFTARMIVQWLASERKQRSVVPVIFWWMSLGGATMLLIYFIWRKDVVGILGQGAGWMVYTRNLWLIHTVPHGDPSDTAAPTGSTAGSATG